MKYLKNKRNHSARDESGQIIVLMGIFLAISVFVISAIPSELSDLPTMVASQRAASPLNEYNHLKEIFGLALQYNMSTDIEIGDNGVVFIGNLTRTNFGGNAMTNIENQIEFLLLKHNIYCDFEKQEGPTFQFISDKGHVVHYIFKINYNDGSTTMGQKNTYTIVCKQWKD